MLTIIVSGSEFYDEETSEFINTEDTILELEHSLVSLSKWESKFGKPFLGPSEKTPEEVISYIEAMDLSGNFSMDVYIRMSNDDLEKIQAYIASNQSATTFSDIQQKATTSRSEVITSELIYYWMVAYNIPPQYETWHLNRLFALIRICTIKNSPQKKMSRNQIASRNRELNAQRRASLGTKG